MKKQIKIGAILGYSNMVINILITLAYIPFMLKLMGQSEYGLYSLVASVIAYLSVLDMGFGNAMIRFVSRSQAKKDNNEAKINGLFLFLYTIIGFVALLLGSIILFNIDKIFASSLTSLEMKKARILFLILLINVALSFPLSVFDSYVTANEKFIFARLIGILKNILKPLLMIPLLFMGYKSIAMALTIASINILCHMLMLIYCFKVLHIRIVFNVKNIDTKILKEIGMYSFFIFLNIIVDNVFTNTDQIILGIVSGTIAVSVYSIANQITMMNTQCSTIISGLFLPKITKLLEEENGDIKVSNLFIKVSRIQLYIMMMILSGFIVFGKKFIYIWAGSEYLDAYYIVLLLIIPAVIPLTQNLGISVIQAKNMHKFRSILYIIIAFFNVLISIPLSKLYQGVGAAIGTAIANIVGQIISMNIYYYKKANLDIPKYWRFFIKFSIQVLVLVLLSLLLVSKINMNLVIMILLAFIFSIIYLAIVYINMNVDEKKQVYGIFDKFFSIIFKGKDVRNNDGIKR